MSLFGGKFNLEEARLTALAAQACYGAGKKSDKDYRQQKAEYKSAVGDLLFAGYKAVPLKDLGVSNSFIKYETFFQGIDGNTSAQIFSNGKTYILAFRGTDGKGDYADDALLKLHNRYINKFEPLLNALSSALSDGNADLIVTGHSLGGAAANELMNKYLTAKNTIYGKASYVSFEAPKAFTKDNGKTFSFGFLNDKFYKFANPAGREVKNSSQGLYIEHGLDIQELGAPHRMSNVVAMLNSIENDEDLNNYGKNYVSPFKLLNTKTMGCFVNTSKIVDHTSLNVSEVIFGNASMNKVRAGSASDVLFGLGGNDHLFGGGGSDRIYGGSGNDRLYGEDGNDTLDGQGGEDRYFGGAGDDTIALTYANTNYHTLDRVIDGGIGNDRIYNAETDLKLSDGTGGYIEARNKYQQLIWQMKNVEILIFSDKAISFENNTSRGIVVRGGNGDDVMKSISVSANDYENNHDTFIGGGGNDTFMGRGEFSGNDGNDSFHFFGYATINGGDGSDTLYLPSEFGRFHNEDRHGRFKDFKPGIDKIAIKELYNWEDHYLDFEFVQNLNELLIERKDFESHLVYEYSTGNIYGINYGFRGAEPYIPIKEKIIHMDGNPHITHSDLIFV